LNVVVSSLIFGALLIPLGWDAFHLDLNFLRVGGWSLPGAAGRWSEISLAWGWWFLVLLGLWGWSLLLRWTFLSSIRDFSAPHLAFASSLVLFIVWLYAWGVHGLLGPWTTAIFLAPGWWTLARGGAGSIPLKALRAWWPEGRVAGWLTALGLALWVTECAAAPLFWDAVADHFHFAREVARTGFLPEGWILFNGMGPKAAQLLLAGGFSLGGERLAHLFFLFPALACVLLAGDWVQHLGGDRRWALLSLVAVPFLLPLFAWGYVEGFLGYLLLASAAGLMGEEGPLTRSALRASAFLLGAALSIKATALFALVAWVGVYLFRRLRPGRGAPLDALAMLLFLIPCFGWLLRTYVAQGNPLFPVLYRWVDLPPGYDEGRLAAILKVTLPPEHSIPGFFRNLWDNLFTLKNGMLRFPVGALLWMSLPWWKRSLDRHKAGPILLFCALTILAWGTNNAMLRHGVVALLLLMVLAMVAWSRALREGRGARILFLSACGVLITVSWLAAFRTTAPFASALGLEPLWDRLERHYYMDRDAFPAYRWVESHSDKDDKVLLFTTFLSYPLQRTAFYDLQWENPTLMRWADESGGADRLALRLRREGVKFVVYHRLESDFLSGGNPRFAERTMPEPEWVRFWGVWMQPVLRLGNSQVYQVRTEAREESAPRGDYPALQEKVLSSARRARKKGDIAASELLLTEFLDKYPLASYVRFIRSGVLAAQGRREAALAGLRRAEKDGLRTAAMYQLMAGLLPEGPERERAAREAERASMFEGSLEGNL